MSTIEASSPTNQCASVDHLAKLKSINIERRVDRRATLSDENDRRASARCHADGELVQDRREINRQANARSVAATAGKKAA